MQKHANIVKICVGILIIGLVAVAILAVNFPPDALTAKYGDELAPALHAHYLEQYQAYLANHPGKIEFGGNIKSLRVLAYNPTCSIVEAQYSYMGLTLVDSYYLLRKADGSWKVVDLADAIDLTDTDVLFADNRLPVPFSCAE